MVALLFVAKCWPRFYSVCSVGAWVMHVMALGLHICWFGSAQSEQLGRGSRPVHSGCSRGYGGKERTNQPCSSG